MDKDKRGSPFEFLQFFIEFAVFWMQSIRLLSDNWKMIGNKSVFSSPYYWLPVRDVTSSFFLYKNLEIQFLNSGK